MKWCLDSCCRRRLDGTLGSRRYQISLRNDNNTRIYRQRFTPERLRELCDTAVDALEGNFHTGGRFESFPLPHGMIELRDNRDKRIFCLILSPALVNNLVSLIDQSLEKYS